jgi:hypothetical protein
LEDLAVCLQRTPSLPALFAREATRVVTPILPKMFHEDGQITVFMPWDPEYASVPGESAPAFDAPDALLHLPSKVVL